MPHYSAILKLKEQGLSLRSIAASTGNSRQKVTQVIDRAKEKGLMGPFDDDMTDKWIEEFLLLEKTLESSGSDPIDLCIGNWQSRASLCRFYIMSTRWNAARTNASLTPIGVSYDSTVPMRTSTRPRSGFVENQEK